MNLESAKSFLSPPLCQVTFVTSNLCDCEYVWHVLTLTSCTNIKKQFSSTLTYSPFILFKNMHLFIYVKINKVSIFWNFKNKFQRSNPMSKCKNQIVPSLTSVNMLMNEHLTYQKTMTWWSTLGCWWNLKIICSSSLVLQ
jgi:hypothetical protein